MKYVPPYGVTANPDAPYINGDPSIGRPGSIPPAAVFENPQREICNLITDSTQVPADTDLHQLTKGIRDGKLNFCIDSGPLNQVEVTLYGPPIQAYNAGLTLHVLIAHTNTGPTRISVGSLNPTTIKRPDGSELQPSDLIAGMIATLVCDGTYFQLQNVSTSEAGAGGDTTVFQTDIPYVHDTGITNHVIGLYSPPLADIREGRTVEVKLLHNVTGPTDFTPNNFPTHPVAHPDGSPIQAGDGVINEVWLLCFDGVQWQRLSGCCYGGGTTPATPAEPSGSGRSLQFLNPAWWTPGACSRLTRTPAMNTNRQVFTYSCFIKRPNAIQLPDITGVWSSGVDSEMITLYAGDDSSYRGDATGAYLTASAQGNWLQQFWGSAFNSIAGYGTAPVGVFLRGATQVGILMDSKWHHLLYTADGAHASIYIDGVLVSQGPTSGNSTINATRPHGIGCGLSDTGAPYWTNYGMVERLAEVNFVDGQSLTWDKFATNIGGIFIPKASPLVPGGAINPGTNGFYLNWQDASSMTSTTLGKDYTSNQNNWQPVNFSQAQVMTDYPVLVPSSGN